MSRVALALVLVAATAEADPPPVWMPAPPPPIGRQTELAAKKLRGEAKAYGAIGLAVLGAGIAVDVVALDVPQGEATTRQNGIVTTEKVRSDANWAELGAGVTLNAVGLVLLGLALYKLRLARRLDESVQ
jgi:hypothetical protein